MSKTKKNQESKEVVKSFFNVEVRDRKGAYVYDFKIKSTSPEEAVEKSKEIEDSLYEKASDIGIVNLASNFMDEYNEKTVKVRGESEKVKSSLKDVDILINGSKFKIKSESLVSVK